MNAFRDEYTNLEYVQLGVLLFALPIAALVGAMLGMVGRWKQGRVLTAALIGMGGAAFVSACLFMLFLSLPVIAGDSRRHMLLELFDELFAPWLTWRALIATSVISVLAAIGLRLRERDSRSGAAAFSMRQLVLLQLFSFVALGCWTGMRFMARDSMSRFERAHRKWSPFEWTVTGNVEGEPAKLFRRFDGPAKNYALESGYLKLAAREPWLRELELASVLEPMKLDLGVLREAKALSTMTLSFGPTSKSPYAALAPKVINLEQATVDQIGEIPALQSLFLSGVDIRAKNLGPLGHSPELNTLHLSECNVGAKAFNHLASQEQITGLTLFQVGIDDFDALQFPRGLIQLSIHLVSRQGISANEFAKLRELRQLRLDLPRIEEAELIAISTLSKLEVLEIKQVQNPQHLACLTKNRELQRLDFHGPVKPRDHAAYREVLMKLAMLPKLARIACPSQFLYDDDGPVLYQPTRNKDEDPRIFTEKMDAERKRLESETRVKMGEFQSAVDEQRKALFLPPLRIEFDAYQAMWLSEGMDIQEIRRKRREREAKE